MLRWREKGGGRNKEGSGRGRKDKVVGLGLGEAGPRKRTEVLVGLQERLNWTLAACTCGFPGSFRETPKSPDLSGLIAADALAGEALSSRATFPRACLDARRRRRMPPACRADACSAARFLGKAGIVCIDSCLILSRPV